MTTEVGKVVSYAVLTGDQRQKIGKVVSYAVLTGDQRQKVGKVVVYAVLTPAAPNVTHYEGSVTGGRLGGLSAAR